MHFSIGRNKYKKYLLCYNFSMRPKNSLVWFAIGIYLLISTYFYATSFYPQMAQEKLSFFFQDDSLARRLHETIISDKDSSTVLLTRVFHNKIAFALNNVSVSLYRAADPVYLYSLSTRPFFDDKQKSPLLPAWEFPFFLISVIILIRKWEKIKKRYFFLLPMLLFSFLCAGLFLPYVSPFKLLPLVITFRIIMFAGLVELWVKK